MRAASGFVFLPDVDSRKQRLDDVARRYPAGRYTIVDDKQRILAAMKEAWGIRLTAVFPRQDHHALDPRNVSTYPQADVTVERIGEPIDYDLPALLEFGEAGHPKSEAP